jgi:hypothetical protein
MLEGGRLERECGVGQYLLETDWMVPECFQVCFLCCRDKIQKGDEVD